MPRQAASALAPAIAALAMSLCTFTLTGAGTAHATACHAAPKSPAPQGSHWYYRTDRTLGRKCWYLASEGRKGQAVTPRPAAADEDANAAPAAPMAEAAARLTEPLRSPPPPTPPAGRLDDRTGHAKRTASCCARRASAKRCGGQHSDRATSGHDHRAGTGR